jgi:seryl-tRNA synthetase
MLDIKILRTNPEIVENSLQKRHHYKIDIQDLINSDKSVRELQVKVDELRKKRNDSSQNIAKLKKDGQDTTTVQAEVREIGDQIKNIETEMNTLQDKIQTYMLAIPNLVHESVPVGEDENANQEVKNGVSQENFHLHQKPMMI